MHRQPADTTSQTEKGAGAPVCRRACAALELLVGAYDFARELQRDPWDFAVEIEDLRRAGLANCELRWLVCRGYVEHAREVTSEGDEVRAFRPCRGLTFSKTTCFCLTEQGLAFARAAMAEARPPDQATAPQPPAAADQAEGPLRPRWDRARQELRLGDVVVKQFKVPAVNQERILAAFEEEGWPVRLDDPLPPQPDQDSKRRLHDTINALNRNQKEPLVRFMGDGSGQGIRWALVERPSVRNGE